MTDIRLPLGGLKFSVRVAVLYVCGERRLVGLHVHQPFAFLPGGALATSEDAPPELLDAPPGEVRHTLDRGRVHPG